MDYGERYGGWRSLPQMFFDKAQALGDKPLFWAKRDGAWQAHSWAKARDDVSALSRGLRALGLAPGERVALVAENRPEWAIVDLAVMAARAVTVPAYTTNTVEDHVHILSNSGARFAIVSTARLAERLIPAAAQVAGVEAVICLEPTPTTAEGTATGVAIKTWDEVVAAGRARPDDVADVVAPIGRGDLACLIYTSGTGGAPKGVMLSHGAILCNCFGAFHLLDDSQLCDVDNDVFLSFLPLSHSYEHSAGLYFPISIGAEIYYAENLDKLVANMAEARPTIMTAVPRLYEVMHQRIVSGVERQGGLKAKLFHKAVELGRRRYEHGPAVLNPIERMQDKLVDKLVRTKIAERFGGRLKAFVSGGGPLNADIGTFFLALGVRLLQGYGLTETAPVVSCNPPNAIRIHTVGPALPGVDVKIAEDGEILVRGELTMDGYWDDPAATSASLKDGWVHTGDIGRIDDDGYIQITDRKKDIIVMSGGDNVAPQRIEGMLCFEPEIGQAMVHGDGHAHLVAILVPEESWQRAFASAHGKDPELLFDDTEFHDAVSAAVDRVNARLSQIEKVRRFIIADAPFTTENAMLTPSLKIRRHMIRERYGRELEGLYARGQAA